MNTINWEKHENPYDPSNFQDDNYDELEDKPKRPMMITPHGIIPINNHNNIATLYNLWWGNTDFKITKTIYRIICNVPGVEICNVLTRYKFLLGIGKAFDEDNVKNDICLALKANIDYDRDNDEILDKYLRQIDTIEDVLKEKNKHYFIYCLPNGQIEYVDGDSENEVAIKSEHLYDCFEQVGGYIRASYE